MKMIFASAFCFLLIGRKIYLTRYLIILNRLVFIIKLIELSLYNLLYRCSRYVLIFIQLFRCNLRKFDVDNRNEVCLEKSSQELLNLISICHLTLCSQLPRYCPVKQPKHKDNVLSCAGSF
jgi:hypothetical protein